MNVHDRSAPPRPGRRFALAALAGTALGAALPARAQSWPERPVRVVVNFPPGGPLDVVARLVASHLSATLKQPFVVENVAGATGHIGAANAARAQPDGYTVLLSIDTPFTLSTALGTTTTYKADELKVVATMGSAGSLIGVHAGVGATSLGALIDRARSQEMTFSTAGNASPGHFAALMLADAAGVKINPIHYKGNAPAVMALASGEVQGGILATGGLLPHIRSGKVRALAIAGSRRSIALPDVPTAAEAGLGGVNLETYFVAMVPAATPPPIVSALQAGIVDALGQQDLRARLQAMDIHPVAATGAQAEAQLTAARERYAAIVRRTGMKAD